MVEQRANNIKLKNDKAHNLKVLFVHFDWVSQMLLTSKYMNWKWLLGVALCSKFWFANLILFFALEQTSSTRLSFVKSG